jgi:hypothetical protein
MDLIIMAKKTDASALTVKPTGSTASLGRSIHHCSCIKTTLPGR